jgi:hypothetical protein
MVFFLILKDLALPVQKFGAPFNFHGHLALNINNKKVQKQYAFCVNYELLPFYCF